MTVVAVTGAAGFIGRATCYTLVGSGFQVRALVRSETDESILPPITHLPAGLRAASDTADSLSRFYESRVSVVATGDLENSESLVAAFEGCEAVIHLAARTTEPRGRRNDDPDFFGANAATTERVCRAAARSGAKRFVYVSSVKAVGEASVGSPITDSTRPAPTKSYGRSKLIAEEAARRVGAESAIEVVVVRPPIVYGPGVRGNFAQLIALSRIARWIPLPFGGIENRRSTLFVYNLASALVTLSHHPGAGGETFLVADGEARSTPALIRSIASAFGGRAKLVAVHPRKLLAAASLLGARAPMETLCKSLEVDDSRLRRLTKWSPAYSFEQAISLTVGAGTYLVSDVAPA
jgi:nucleoside-diphosphate-sugar epimerase